MLGLDNPIHIALVLVVVLLVFGAKRLPEMGKSMGEGMRGFKDSLSGAAPSHDAVPSAQIVHVADADATAEPVVPVQPVVAVQPVAPVEPVAPVQPVA